MVLWCGAFHGRAAALSNKKMANAKRLIHQECHSVILWDKPFVNSSTAKIRQQPFSHEIPPAPSVKSRWNYPVDPPRVRGNKYVLIEEKSKKLPHESLQSQSSSHQDQSQSTDNYEGRFPSTRAENFTITSPKIHSIHSSREKTHRPQSATRSMSSTYEEKNIDTLRPVSAPKSRHDSFSNSSSRTCENNDHRSARSSPSLFSSGIAMNQESSRLTQRPSSSASPLPSSPIDETNHISTSSISSTRPSSALPPTSQSISVNSSRPQSAHPADATSNTSNQIKRIGFVPNPLFKSQKKTYFDFKRLSSPATDEIFQPSTEIIQGGLHPGSYTAAAMAAPAISDLPSNRKASHKLKKKKSNTTPIQSQKPVVLGRSQETARIHHLIDDMMLKLATTPSSQERIAIKHEFTQIITRFAQQPSKGGDY